MATSAARVEANRKNALLSTGPKTAEGKARSRTNALKHGYYAAQLRTSEDEEAASKVADSGWMVQQVVIIMDRISRVQNAENRERGRVQLRAATSWAVDKKLEVETLAHDLAKRPSEVLANLLTSPQGCEWLITRWSLLADLAGLETGWGEPERALAFDLLGIPTELRKAQAHPTLDNESHPLTLARTQIDRLKKRVLDLTPLDDFDRETARQGLHQPDRPTDRRLRSHEQALYRRLKDALHLLGTDPTSPEISPAPKIEAKPLEKIKAKVEPEVSRENQPKPAPQPEPLPLPRIPSFTEPASRPDRRTHKADKRRAAAERKMARRLELALAGR